MDTIFVEKISFLKYFHTVKKKDEINIKVVAEVGIISFLCVDSTQDIEFFIRSYKQLLIHKYVTIFLFTMFYTCIVATCDSIYVHMYLLGTTEKKTQSAYQP